MMQPSGVVINKGEMKGRKKREAAALHAASEQNYSSTLSLLPIFRNANKFLEASAVKNFFDRRHSQFLLSRIGSR